MVMRAYDWQALLFVSCLLGTGISGCSNNGEKEDAAEAKQVNPTPVQTNPQGQWVAVQPNMVWVPQGTQPQQPVPVYPSQAAVPQYVPQSQSPMGQHTTPSTPNNPWAVAPRSYHDRGPEQYAAPQPYNQWQQQQIPQNRYRPLDEEDRYQTPRQPQYVQPAQPAWSGAAPYDRPMGSSRQPGYPAYPGYPGASTGYGTVYPGYSVSPYGYGGLPGTYGGTWPGGTAVPAPGVW